MKNFIAFWGLLAVMAFGFYGCSDDDEGVSSDLIGTWECVYSYYYEKKNGEIIYEEENDDVAHIIQFDSDGTCRDKNSYNDNWDQMGIWNYKNGILSITSEDGDGGTYVETVSLKSLTSTEFVIERYEKETYYGDNYEYYDKMIYHKISE